MSAVQKQTYYGTGRRKTSVARVFISKGEGSFKVNNREVSEYFGSDSTWLVHATAPLKVVEASKMFDVKITVNGGGISGQAGAVRLGLARALLSYEKDGNVPQPEAVEDQNKTGLDLSAATDAGDESSKRGVWHSTLRKHNMLTRDPRMVLRKLVGLVKARKAKQFSKR